MARAVPHSMNIKDLPEYYQEQARQQLQVGRTAFVAPSIAPMPSTPQGKATACCSSEKELQRQCEVLLAMRGYWPMTANSLVQLLSVDSGHCEGFFWHLHKAQGNPIQPDITVIAWPNTRPALMVELKAGDNPAYQPGQKEAITAGLWEVAFNLVGFDALLDRWETTNQFVVDNDL